MKFSKKSRFYAFATFSMTAVVAGVGLLSSGKLAVGTLGSESVVWNHYAAYKGDAVTIGNKEYWIQCGTDEVVYAQPAGGTIVDKTGGASTAGYGLHDARYYAGEPTAYDFSAKKSGAGCWNVTDNSDYDWGQTFNAGGVKYKSYASKVFKNTLPKVDFNYYESVEMGVETTIWNSGYKFGFDADVQTTGMEPTISVQTGGKMTLSRLDDTTVRMVIKHANAGMDITHDFVGAEYVRGQAGVYFYTYATGDAYFEFKDWTPKVHNYVETKSTTAMAAVKKECACGDVKYELPTWDFTANKYDAKAYNITGASDYATQLMTIEAAKIQYKVYGSPANTFSLTMPKIKFADFATVSIAAHTANWYEGNGMGFTQEQAEGKTVHTTYGGEKNGSLSFAWNGETLTVTFVFEYINIQTTISDADVIAGNKGFTLYTTDLYDRYIDFSNFTFTLK